MSPTGDLTPKQQDFIKGLISLSAIYIIIEHSRTNIWSFTVCVNQHYFCTTASVQFIFLMTNKGKNKKLQFHKDVKRRRVRQSLAQRIKRLDRRQVTFKTCVDQPMEPQIVENQPAVKVQTKTKVLVKRSTPNLIQSLNARIANKVDFLLYGMMYIDSNALRSEGEDCSLFKSMFNFYSINYVKVTHNCLILKIHKTYENMYPVKYVVERLKSEGNRDLFEIAETVQRIHQRLVNFRQAKRMSLFDHQIDKYLQRLEGKLSMAMIAPDVMAFSKELLDLSGYSMDQIADSCLLNRSFLFDLFLPDSYMQELKIHMSRFDLSRKYRTGQLSPHQYQSQSCFHNFSSIIDKNNNKIKVKSKRYNLQPGIVYWEIEEIIGNQKLINYQSFSKSAQVVAFKELRAQRNYKDIQRLMGGMREEERAQDICKQQKDGLIKQE